MSAATETLPLDIFVTYFSAYSAHTIEFDGALYPTVEHAYHCQRYDDPAIRQEILQARSPWQAWRISQRYKSQQQAGFNDRKAEVMEALCRAKLQQHEDVREALLASGTARIVKHITTGPNADGFWDDGADGSGRNESGKIWMRLRAELLGPTL